ncbi:hypothetical protein AKJ65_07530 [candidate division MSBL1 archaeon SCGC-AAA259E19]|uniref:Uncharacterized protein n=1 Tax=candidate division MSBL1 archaeon SCGC-AAA259E19 TaxID=1698264 RepID=A0A133UE41_9EURY|nr:hypothetical protein AKJ65_07530 [candidate division MSBL1 archaeon SCGC-AAA259E19]
MWENLVPAKPWVPEMSYKENITSPADNQIRVEGTGSVRLSGNAVDWMESTHVDISLSLITFDGTVKELVKLMNGEEDLINAVLEEKLEGRKVSEVSYEALLKDLIDDVPPKLGRFLGSVSFPGTEVIEGTRGNLPEAVIENVNITKFSWNEGERRLEIGYEVVLEGNVFDREGLRERLPAELEKLEVDRTGKGLTLNVSAGNTRGTSLQLTGSADNLEGGEFKINASGELPRTLDKRRVELSSGVIPVPNVPIPTRVRNALSSLESALEEYDLTVKFEAFGKADISELPGKYDHYDNIWRWENENAAAALPVLLTGKKIPSIITPPILKFPQRGVKASGELD